MSPWPPRSGPLRSAEPFLRLALLVVGLEAAAAVLAHSVGAVDGAILSAAPIHTGVLRGIVLCAAAAAVLAGLRVLAGAALAAAARIPALSGRRFGETAPARDDEPQWDLAWAGLLAIATVVGTPRGTLLMSRSGAPFEVPLLARAASDLIPWVLAGLGAEAVLAALRRLRRRDAGWWLGRGGVGLYWAFLCLKALTGPNLMAGDALEWAARLGADNLPQQWLTRAPAAAGAWWPIVRTGLSTALLATVIVALGEFWQAWTGWRRTAAARGKGRTTRGSRADGPA